MNRIQLLGMNFLLFSGLQGLQSNFERDVHGQRFNWIFYRDWKCIVG